MEHFEMSPKTKLSHLAIPKDLVAYLWKTLALPPDSLAALRFTTPSYAPSPPFLSSSFKVDLLASSSIALFNLAVAHYHALCSRTGSHLVLPDVTVDTLAASLEFKSERMYTLNGVPQPTPSSIGGLHKTSDGYVRIHDGFQKHRDNVCRILKLSSRAGRKEIAAACLTWQAHELETAATMGGAVITALRTETEWENSAMGRNVPDDPIAIRSLGRGGECELPLRSSGKGRMSGVRVLEFSRVIAAPVAGRALAAHGADVSWVTSPQLEDQPYLDIEFSRGKRSVRLDLNRVEDLEKVKQLVEGADVFIQGFRPTSLAKKGLGPEELSKINPRLIYASMSAYPQVEEQPWRGKRGFDSIVQTCSGINVAEAEAWSASKDSEKVPAVVLPCQALDHGSGFLLAAGIVAAMSRRIESGEGQLVEVSLAGTSKLLRSLGQKVGGFESGMDANSYAEALEKYSTEAETLFEQRASHFGTLNFLKHSGHIAGVEVGWERMPKSLGSDAAAWQ